MASYFVCSGAAGTNRGLSWFNAHVSIPGCMTAQALVGGDIIYVHNTHNYLAGAAITWTLPESGNGQMFVYCVDGGDAAFTAAGAVMGSTVGTLTTGGSESTNFNGAFTINCDVFCHGLTIKAGTGASDSAADILVGGSNGHVVTAWQACTFWTNSTNTGATISTGNTFVHKDTFKDCVFRFGATGQTMVVSSGQAYYYNCSISASGSSPTTLFSGVSTRAGVLFCSGCDWSLATNVVNRAIASVTNFYFNNCTIGTPVTGTAGIGNQNILEFHACAAVDGTNGANILQYYLDCFLGTVQDDQTVYLTTGSAQGTQDDGTVTPYSLKMTPGALVSPSWPLYTPWIYQKIAATGSKTITMLAADTEAAVLKDRELFLEVEYMGGAAPANSPQSALEGTWPLVGVYADFTTAGSNLSDTNVAWTGVAENSTYTLSKTVTLDEQGYVRCRVGVGKQTTNPVYVDGKIGVA